MAGAAPYTVILDANVLYPALLRDVLLTLAHADIYTAKWTATIEQEWTRAMLRNFPGKAADCGACSVCERLDGSVGHDDSGPIRQQDSAADAAETSQNMAN